MQRKSDREKEHEKNKKNYLFIFFFSTLAFILACIVTLLLLSAAWACFHFKSNVRRTKTTKMKEKTFDFAMQNTSHTNNATLFFLLHFWLLLIFWQMCNRFTVKESARAACECITVSMCVHLRYSFACMRVRCGSFAIIYSSSLLCHSAYDFASLICTLTFSVGMQGGNWWSNNECFELDVQLLKNGVQCPMIRHMLSVNQVNDHRKSRWNSGATLCLEPW